MESLLISDLGLTGLLDGLNYSNWVWYGIRYQSTKEADGCASQQSLECLLPEAVSLPIELEVVVGDEPWVVADHSGSGWGDTTLVERF